MIEFNTVIRQFEDQGEKTGWSYIEVPADLAQQMKPGNKKSFRVKGTLDATPFSGVALMPMGGGDFIMALNAAIRKEIRKNKGAMVHVTMEPHDDFSIKTPDYLLECFGFEPEAGKFFNSLAKSHRDYFVKWIESAKTEPTRVRRITQAITALSAGLGYGEMIRMFKKTK